MATTPPGAPPGGPPNNDAFDPVMDALNQAKSVARSVADEFSAALKDSLSSTKELSKAWKDLHYDLKSNIDSLDDMEDKLKLIVTATKTVRDGVRAGNKDNKETVAMLKLILDEHKNIQKEVNKGTKLYDDSVKKVKELEDLIKNIEKGQGEFNKEIKDSEELIKKVNGVLHDQEIILTKISKLAKGMAMGPTMQKMGDTMKAYAAFGMGKGTAGKMEKFAGMGQVAAKVQAASAARYENDPSFKAKRDAATKSMKDLYGDDWAKDVSLQRSMAKKSGIGWLGRRRLEKTGNLETFAKGGTNTEIASAMTRGGGETALAAIGDALGELAPAIALFGGAVEMLIKAFDFYVKQNKDMEAAIGKGGLFGAVGVYTADALEGMRQVLTPNLDMLGGLASSLGMTWDRNLKMAQAMSEGGMNLSSVVAAGHKAGVVNPLAAKSEFGPGAFGEIQRTAATGGRLAGLSDPETIQRMLMMADQYRETLEGSADFFTKVRKDTASAGLSYTKYISIVDEVLGHFTRLNKTFDQTMTLLAALGKTGRVGAENLREYMDWLTGGAGAGEQGTPAQGFLLSTMSQDERDRQAGLRKTEYEAETRNAPKALGLIKGFSADQIKEGLSADKTPEQQQNFLGKMTTAMNDSGMDAQQQKSAQDFMDKIIKLKQNQGAWQDFAKTGNVAKMMMMMKASGATEQNSMALNSAALSSITTGITGGSLKDLIHDPQKYAGQHMEVISKLQALGIKEPEKYLNNLRPMSRLSTEGAIQEAIAPGKEGEDAANELLKVLESTGYKADLKGGTAQTFFQKNKGNQDIIDALMGTQEMVGRWQDVAAKGREREAQAVKDKETEDARELAKRTQDSADAVKNALSTYFTRIINAIEFIANSWFFKGTPMNLSEKEVGDLKQDKADTEADIQKLKDRNDELEKKGDKLTQPEKDELAKNKQDIADKNTFMDQLNSAITSKTVIGDAPQAAITAALMRHPGFKTHLENYKAPGEIESTGGVNLPPPIMPGVPVGGPKSAAKLSDQISAQVATMSSGPASVNIVNNYSGVTTSTVTPPNDPANKSNENNASGAPTPNLGKHGLHHTAKWLQQHPSQ